MKRHINQVARNCFHHIRRLKQIRRLLGPEVTVKLVTSLIYSRLDYCNAILAVLRSSTISPLQRVQNATARLVAQLRPRGHVTPTMRVLHWLPVEYRIICKLCLLMHHIRNGEAPVYLADIMTATADMESRSGLRSASSGGCEIPRENADSPLLVQELETVYLHVSIRSEYLIYCNI